MNKENETGTIRQVIQPFIDDGLLYSYWNAILTVEEKYILFRFHIPEHLSLCAVQYCNSINKMDLYYKISTKYNKLANSLGYAVDWNLDLHSDSDNAQNFFDEVDDIVADLATESEYWFAEIVQNGPEITIDQLKQMVLGFIDAMGIWSPAL